MNRLEFLKSGLMFLLAPLSITKVIKKEDQFLVIGKRYSVSAEADSRYVARSFSGIYSGARTMGPTNKNFYHVFESFDPIHLDIPISYGISEHSKFEFQEIKV
jgi:hypothetical protein